MDRSGHGFLDLKQLILVLGIVCSNRYTEKLKLLYILHSNPLLPQTEIDMKKNVKHDDTEVATEAENYFSDNTSEMIEALSSIENTFIPPISGFDQISTNPEYSTISPPRSMESNSVFYVDLPNEYGQSLDFGSSSSRLHSGIAFDSIDTISDTSEKSSGVINPSKTRISIGSTTETRSLNSLRVFFDHPDANFSKKNIPNMSQVNFMALWTSLLELLGEKSDTDVQKACKTNII